MDEPAAKKAKGERATHEQLECFVHFCREHPQLQTGKNNPNNPQLVGNLWEDVSAHLNALRGPSRTATKWKETLGLWKYQLRTKARKLKMEQRLTGGGPCSKSLSEFEELALCTFGVSAVDGVAEIGELGVTRSHEYLGDNQSRAMSLPPSQSAGTLPTNQRAISLPPSPGVISLPTSQSAQTFPPSPGAISLPPSPGVISLPTSQSAQSFPPSPGAISLPPSPGVISLPRSPAAAPPITTKERLMEDILRRISERDERDIARDERDAQILEVLKDIASALKN